MEGVDVSWMTHTAHNGQKDYGARSTTIPKKPQSKDAPSNLSSSLPKTIPHRPSFQRVSSVETLKSATANATTPSPKATTPPTTGSPRRNSWLSSISSKFSSSPPAHTAVSPAAAQGIVNSPISPILETPQPRPPGPSAPKNAVLQHVVSKTEGDAPYIPAPPKTGQPNFLQSAFRRLSSSGGQLSTSKVHSNGICERRVMNIDSHRERCRIAELDQSKLRRVAFCVDVEIASSPRYAEDDVTEETPQSKDKKDRKRISEKGEGDALRNPQDAITEKDNEGASKPPPEEPQAEKPDGTTPAPSENKTDPQSNDKDATKKKDKKKRSEEERKARKEKKRKLAEANGSIPVELVKNPSDSSLLSTLDNSGAGTPKTQASPTTDPLRIYRRCCQLRETPILKKVTEQLGPASTSNSLPGVITKLDLSGYWLQLQDLITLGDYLAVVPVKELVMENCGLTDEGTRVILAGLLAAKNPTRPYRRKNSDGAKGLHGGFIEHLNMRNNIMIGYNGWRHICLFINMSRSIKSIDLSKVPFPQPPPPSPQQQAANNLHPTLSASSTTSTTSTVVVNPEISYLLEKSIGERLAGPQLELLNISQCGLNTEQLGELVNGVLKSGLCRFGIAGNNITADGMQHVIRFIKGGKCEGLDLGGNNLNDQISVIANALEETNNIYALSLADCNLNPDSLWTLFPALTKLKNFRFIDLSQNRKLFNNEPSALPLLRRYLPKFPVLRRIHLADVDMTPEQAIALAEILPESPNLAHVSLLENPRLAALADAKDEANREEACALYASLMAAVRVSTTIICVDIEPPSKDSSEVVKALAKQVVAYCLWNMERDPVAEIRNAAVATHTEATDSQKEVEVPEVLMHIVGHVEGNHENHDDDDPAPDEDYVIGGTGVVKALAICLSNKGNDLRKSSTGGFHSGHSDAGSGTSTPVRSAAANKPKDMSKNLLGSARKIRHRLQPALIKESKLGNIVNYNRLLFLDQTLEGMIKRFEEEYPETRLSTSVTSPLLPAQANPLDASATAEDPTSDGEPVCIELPPSDEEEGGPGIKPSLSRHGSDVSLASRALSQEEGRMHRFGQKWRRDMLKPEDDENGQIETQEPEDQEGKADHIELLRAMVKDIKEEELSGKAGGATKNLDWLKHDGEVSSDRATLLKQLQDSDPEGWQVFKNSQETAQKNAHIGARSEKSGDDVAASGAAEDTSAVEDTSAIE